MTTASILSILCQWINGLGYKAIQGPSNNPAPAGRYISVVAQGTRQHGDMLVPGPVHGNQVKYKSSMQVLQVQLYEVEGDGEWLRDIRNRMQCDEFDAFVKSKVPASVKDDGFEVWEIGEIVDNGFQDGTFYIQQKTMTADFQYSDYILHTTPRMESVDGTINNEQLHVEVNNG